MLGRRRGAGPQAGPTDRTALGFSDAVTGLHVRGRLTADLGDIAASDGSTTWVLAAFELAGGPAFA